jgi:hypothetical protein
MVQRNPPIPTLVVTPNGWLYTKRFGISVLVDNTQVHL